MGNRTSKNTELGDQASFCVSCGWARRFYPGVVEAPTECPACESPVIHECPACATPLHSVMLVDCSECGVSLREAYAAGGVRIRRAKRLPIVDRAVPNAADLPEALPETPRDR